MTANSQSRALARLKGGSRPQAILNLCSQPEYKFDLLQRVAAGQHKRCVLKLVNSLFKIAEIRQQNTWQQAAPILLRVLPHLDGGLARATRDGQRMPFNFASGVTDLTRKLARFALVQTVLDCWTRHAGRDIESAFAYVEKAIDVFNRHSVEWLHSSHHMPSRLDWAIQAFERVGVRTRYMKLRHRINTTSSRELENPKHAGETVVLHTTARNGMLTFHGRPHKECFPEAFMQAHKEWEQYEDHILEAVTMLNTVAREEARYWDVVLSHPYKTELHELPGFAKGSLIWYRGDQYTAVPGYNSPQMRYEHWLSAIKLLEKSGERIPDERMERLERAANQARREVRTKQQRARSRESQSTRDRSASSQGAERSRSTSSSRSPSPAGGLAGFLQRIKL